MKFRTAYSKPLRVSAPVGGKSVTEQHHAKTCNINAIMAKYQKTGLIDHITKHKGRYGDVSGADFQTAQNLIAEQETIFHELPASVRSHFDNDPAQYLDLVMTEEGQQELATLLNPPPAENVPPEPTSDGTNQPPPEVDTTTETVVETS